jgi:hypothetical protein
MAGMIRKQLYISEDQERRLKLRARARAQSEADIVRGYIEVGLAEEETDENAAEEAWQRQLSLMEQRAKLGVPRQTRTWRREDAYEERLARYPRGH